MTCTHEYEGRRCAKCGRIKLSPDVEASHRAQDAFFRRVYLKHRKTTDELERWENPREPRPVVDKDGNRI